MFTESTQNPSYLAINLLLVSLCFSATLCIKISLISLSPADSWQAVFIFPLLPLSFAPSSAVSSGSWVGAGNWSRSAPSFPFLSFPLLLAGKVWPRAAGEMTASRLGGKRCQLQHCRGWLGRGAPRALQWWKRNHCLCGAATEPPGLGLVPKST